MLPKFRNAKVCTKIFVILLGTHFLFANRVLRSSRKTCKRIQIRAQVIINGSNRVDSDDQICAAKQKRPLSMLWSSLDRIDVEVIYFQYVF